MSQMRNPNEPANVACSRKVQVILKALCDKSEPRVSQSAMLETMVFKQARSQFNVTDLGELYEQLETERLTAIP
ncbi:MAG: hypothetical protein MI923_16120 [Phycisphaerales bacterium]|nr:hypothetical protein [Phycisphaerales bacterium]